MNKIGKKNLQVPTIHVTPQYMYIQIVYLVSRSVCKRDKVICKCS